MPSFSIFGYIHCTIIYELLCFVFSCPDGPQMAADAVLYLTQICCFPFAIDMNEDLLMGIYE